MGKILLFDIDQTLIYTSGAGGRAMTIAFEAIWGVPNGFKGMAFAGRTDPSLVREALANAGLLPESEAAFQHSVERFEAIYLDHLARTLVTTPGGHVLPGVVSLLTALRPVNDAHLGVATGNFQGGADLKLRHYGLGDFFLAGGYGNDAEDRGQMVAAAARRLATHDAVPAGAHQIFVIGDSPHDVNAGRVNGYTTIGVATGHSSRDQLLAAGADYAFDSLAELTPVLSAFGLPA